MKNIPIKKFWPGIAWFFIVLILICLPGSGLPKVDSWFSRIYFDKWVHAGLFGMLALLWMLPVAKSNLSHTQKRSWIIIIAMTVCVWGIITEYIQKYFVSGRGFEWWDWAADSVGILIAAAIIVVKSR